MSDFWNEWGEKTTGPLPPGEYTVRVDQVAMSYGIDGTPKTEFTLVVTDGQPHARRLIWEKWSHKPTQGWKLRRMWEACGMQGRPPGDNPEQVFANAVQVSPRANAPRASVFVPEPCPSSGVWGVSAL